ncbi:hypothetical protein AAZX31_01G125500 [Glycine max]
MSSIEGGGINRFKAHLARKKGQVEACKKVLANVQHEMKQLLEQIEKSKKRKVQQEQSNESNTFEMDENPVRIIEELRGTPKPISSKSQKGKNTPYVDDYFMPRTIPEAQPSLKSVLHNKQIIEKCDKAIAKWMIDALVSFNAINLAYYQPMIDAISSMSPGYKATNFYRIRGPLLNMWVDELFKEMVLYVGAENVVHIVTDNAANYVATDRLLEKEFPKKYWSPYFGKFEEYIYNHCYALFLMRQHTCGRDILRPAPTRFVTNFIALQSILVQKDALRAMVTSRDWIGSTYAKDSKAKKFVEQILDSSFWKQCAHIVKLTKPLVCVLRIIDNEDKPTMEEMVRRFHRYKRKVEPYLEVLDRRWDSQLCKDLHVVGYWLNPACRFNAEEFEKYRNTQSSILEVIDRYTHGDLENRLRQQNHDPINLETLDDHSNWVLEESPLFLTHEEVETLRNDLANMSIQSTSDDIYKSNMDEYEDDDVSQPPDNTMEDVNPNESNIGEESHSFDEEGLPEVYPTLSPWI